MTRNIMALSLIWLLAFRLCGRLQTPTYHYRKLRPTITVAHRLRPRAPGPARRNERTDFRRRNLPSLFLCRLGDALQGSLGGLTPGAADVRQRNHAHEPFAAVEHWKAAHLYWTCMEASRKKRVESTCRRRTCCTRPLSETRRRNRGAATAQVPEPGARVQVCPDMTCPGRLRVNRVGEIEPLPMSAPGISRHFAATQYAVAFGAKRT